MSLQIKSSKHTVKFANAGKKAMLVEFLHDYRSAVEFFIHYMWSTKITWGDKIFDVSSREYNIPKYISTVDIDYKTDLSARAIKCASAQAIGVVSSVLRKLQKLEFKRKLSVERGYSTDKIDHKINEFILTKPTCTNKFYANLNSICVEFHKPSTIFDGFMILKSIGKKYGKIAIPIKNHKHTNNLIKNCYEQKTTWLIGDDAACSIWSRSIPVQKVSGIKVGADQGLLDCVTLSDGQTTPTNNHGYTLKTIIKKLTNKHKGSKGYLRTQQHRTNYINWSINQLDFSKIKELGFEDVKNIRSGKNTSALLKGWTYTEIASKIEDKCLNEGVLLVKQGSIYRSQRCNVCGFVHKDNRKGKVFTCGNCNHAEDADLNGAKNHSIDIKPIPFEFMCLKLNTKGFFWKVSGCYNLDGEEITVPLDMKTIKT